MQRYLFWVLLVFLAVGVFFPIIGTIALMCMAAPVLLSVWKGRFWCGNYCPRGSFYDVLCGKISPHRPYPAIFRDMRLRLTVIAVLFAVFGYNFYKAWPYPEAIGALFIKMILVTTLIGIVLGLFYHERSWCAFCPMGTLSKLVAPKAATKVYVSNACVGCGRCTKACPMLLKPYEAKGSAQGYLEPDCIKCGKCRKACPKKAIELK